MSGKNKFKSRAGVEIDAYVVTDVEKTLQAPTDEGQEMLRAGDALVGFNGKTFRLRAELFQAIFGDEKPAAAEPTGDERKGKGSK